MPEGKLLKKASLEERIRSILLMPELELDENAYKGKYELNNFGSIKSFILKKLRLMDKNGRPTPYINQNTGDKIIIGHDSAGKLAKFWRDGDVYQKSLAHIPQIIEQMQFLDKMPADKENAKFDKYSYYVTPVKIDNETYTVLSEVGHGGQEVYYTQNVFKGTPKDVFEGARNSIEKKYSRLKKILRKTKEDGLEVDLGNA